MKYGRKHFLMVIYFFLTKGPFALELRCVRVTHRSRILDHQLLPVQYLEKSVYILSILV